MRAARLTLCIGLATVGVASAKLDPAHWSLELQPTAAPPGSKVLARLEAKLDAGWHLYSPTTPRGGPNPTTIHLTENPAVATFRVFEPSPRRAFDPNFNLDTETYEGSAAFLVEVELKKDASPGTSDLTAAVRYQACNDRLCLPPQTRTAAAALKIDASASAAPAAIPAGYIEVKPGAVSAAAAAPAGPSKPTADSQDLGLFLLTAFGFGLAAIFTPCVFPMIPITMSF